MSVSKIWVFAEASDGKVSTTTLEMLAKASDLADTVECVTAAGADEIDHDLTQARVVQTRVAAILHHPAPVAVDLDDPHPGLRPADIACQRHHPPEGIADIEFGYVAHELIRQKDA